MTAPRIAVVGGGISGLTAAFRLRRSLGPAAEIVLVEQRDELGGKLHTEELAGTPFDVGAEAFLVRRPEVLDLAEELGLRDDVVHPGPAAARIRAGGGVHPLPRGTVMGVPTSVDSVRDVLSPAGADAVRAEAEAGPVRWGETDISVGALLRDRMGREVVDRLVEPLLGGVYAGSADSLGVRATMPALAAALDAGAPTVTAAARAAAPAGPGQSGPVFGAFRGGYRTLLRRLAEESAARVRLGLPVRGLVRVDGGWRVEIGAASAPEAVDVDAVVLAVPAPSARRLLSEAAPEAARHLSSIELASSVVVSMALPPGTAVPDPSGVLVARGEAHADGTPFTAKAFTFSSRKWPHLLGGDGEVLVRASVGRFGEAGELRRDDGELVELVRADLAQLTGIDDVPVDTIVTRWGGGLPQYGVGHLDAVAHVERAVAKAPGLAVAGAMLHGVGVPACVATATTAAAGVTRYLLGR